MNDKEKKLFRRNFPAAIAHGSTEARTMAGKIHNLAVFRKLAQQSRRLFEVRLVQMHERIVQQQKRRFAPRKHLVRKRQPQAQRAHRTYAALKCPSRRRAPPRENEREKSRFMYVSTPSSFSSSAAYFRNRRRTGSA